jgi:phosphonate transport system permease protein
VSAAQDLPLTPRATAVRLFVRAAAVVLGLGILAQAFVVCDVRLGLLIGGVRGMADLLHRALPPDVTVLGSTLWPALETFDTALLGTLAASLVALPLATLAAHNTTPSPVLFAAARAVIGIARAVPDLVWALLFVTAVGLGTFPGVLALAVHSVGMLGRLFAEVVEDIDMGPVEALTLTGASRLQVFSHAVVPGVAPSLLSIALYRLDENVRSSLVLGFVGAGGIGFQLLTAMNLFQYRTVSLDLCIIFVMVVAVERLSAALRRAAS